MHSLQYLLVLEEDSQPYHSKGPALGYKMAVLRGGGSGARAVEGALVLSFLGRGWGQLPASPEFSFLPASQDHCGQ